VQIRPDLLYVSLVFQEQVQCGFCGFFVENIEVQNCQGASPVERLADAGQLLEVHLTNLLYYVDDLPRERFAYPRHFELDDLHLLFCRREIYEQMQTAALERIAHLARVVAGQDNVGNMLRLERAEFGNTDLKISENLEKKRFELGVGLVNLEWHGEAAEEG
jgi:hypothetical protein